MSMESPTEDRIRAVLKGEISRLCDEPGSADGVPDDFPLFDFGDSAQNLGLDSLGALELAITLEEELGVVPAQDLDFKELATVNDIVAFVLRLSEQRRDGHQ